MKKLARVRRYNYIYLATLILVTSHTYLYCQSDNYLLYIWGNYNQLESNNIAAAQCFKTIIQNDGPIYAYPGYINHLFAIKNYSAIVQLMPIIDRELKDDLATQLLLVKALEITRNTKIADQKIIDLASTFRTHPEVCYGAAVAHMRANDTIQALKIVSHFLENTTEKPMHFIFYFLKTQLYMNNGDHKNAYENIQKCLSLNPSFDQGWLLSGLINELKGNIDKAINDYQTLLQLVGHNNLLEQQISYLLLKQNQKAQHNPIYFSNLFEKALNLYQNHNFQQALGVINQHLAEQPTDEPAHLLKIELLCALDQWKSALTYIDNLLRHNPQQEIWFRSLHVLYQAKSDIRTNVLNMLTQISVDYPTNIHATLYLADIYMKQQELVKASLYLKKAINIVEDQSLKSKVLYQLAIIYFQQQNYSGLEQTIEYSMRNNYNFTPLLNIAAYYFASKGKNLKRAEQIISQVLQGDSHNPHYLDTHAFILYKKGKYQDAQNVLSNIIKEVPDDFFIQKHLSKVYYKQGNVKAALETMQQAQKLICSRHENEKCLTLLAKWQSTNN